MRAVRVAAAAGISAALVVSTVVTAAATSGSTSVALSVGKAAASVAAISAESVRNPVAVSASGASAARPGSVGIDPGPRHIGHSSYGSVQVNGRWVERDCAAPAANRWGNAPAASLRTTARPDRVLVIGDSLTWLTKSATAKALADKGWSGRVNAVGGRYIYDAIPVIKSYARRGALPKTIVIALGTNGKGCPAWSRRVLVEDVLKALGPKRTVYWVNVTWKPFVSSHSPSEFNSLLASVAAKRSNVRLVDWRGVVDRAQSTGVSVLTGDGIHVTAAGGKKRVRMIASALGSPS